MSDRARDWKTGQGFTNGLTQRDIWYLRDEFRACEQRVRDESADDLTITRGVNYAHGYADGYAKGRKDAYAAGLDAAREAVSALSEQWVCQDTVRDALAAIDALREKP